MNGREKPIFFSLGVGLRAARVVLGASVQFRLFRSSRSPVLLDFGSSSLKLLQLDLGEQPRARAVAELACPEELLGSALDARVESFVAALPAVLRAHGFKGRRAVVSPFSQHTLVHHLTLGASESERPAEAAAAKLAAMIGCDASALIVRTIPVHEFTRDGALWHEIIAIAMGKRDAMRYVDACRRAGLDVVGMHAGIAALPLAFAGADALPCAEHGATMYVDIGYGGTKVVIAEGDRIEFAKSIAVAGRSLDRRIATARGALVGEARLERMTAGFGAWRAGGRDAVARGEAPCAVARAANDTVDALAEELSMCVRYHAAMFGEHAVSEVVFTGGEARDRDLCHALAESLHLPAKSGDPLAALVVWGAPHGLPEPHAPHPAWAVACGLARAPLDL